jgi:hypothetical protein
VLHLQVQVRHAARSAFGRTAVQDARPRSLGSADDAPARGPPGSEASVTSAPYRSEEQKAVERQEAIAKGRRALDELVRVRSVIRRCSSAHVRVKRDELVELIGLVENLANVLFDGAG